MGKKKSDVFKMGRAENDNENEIDNEIGDEGAKKIGESLEYNSTLITLFLDSNYFK